MSAKNNGVSHSMLLSAKERRRNAYTRLSNQLKSGSKPCKETKVQIPLTDKNKTRIEKELATLKLRF